MMLRAKTLLCTTAIAFLSASTVHAGQSWTQEELLRMKEQAAALQSKASDYMKNGNPGVETKQAGQGWSMSEIKEIAENARKIKPLDEPIGDIMPWTRMLAEMNSKIKGQRMQDSEQIVSDLLKAKKQSHRYAQEGGIVPKDHRLEVYVSWNMSITELREIFLEAGGNPSIRVLFRGVPEGMSINGAMARLKNQIVDLKIPPDIRIDPKSFRKNSIEYVPEVVLYEKNEDTEVVRSHIRGVSNLERAIETMQQQGAEPDSYGPTIKIAEPDLIEEMTRRMRNMDMAELKNKAYQNYWSKKQFYRLAPADRERVRELDPTVVVQKPIVDHEGRVLVSANSRFNPLKIRPFGYRMIIFDGTDPKQTIVAAKIMRDTPANLKPMLMTTSLDRDRGWYALKTLEEQIDAPVFVLTPEIIQRWQLEKVPAFVEAKGHKFIIHEVPANGDAS